MFADELVLLLACVDGVVFLFEWLVSSFIRIPLGLSTTTYAVLRLAPSEA